MAGQQSGSPIRRFSSARAAGLAPSQDPPQAYIHGVGRPTAVHYAAGRSVGRWPGARRDASDHRMIVPAGAHRPAGCCTTIVRRPSSLSLSDGEQERGQPTGAWSAGRRPASPLVSGIAGAAGMTTRRAHPCAAARRRQLALSRYQVDEPLHRRPNRYSRTSCTDAIAAGRVATQQALDSAERPGSDHPLQHPSQEVARPREWRLSTAERVVIIGWSRAKDPAWLRLPGCRSQRVDDLASAAWRPTRKAQPSLSPAKRHDALALLQREAALRVPAGLVGRARGRGRDHSRDHSPDGEMRNSSTSPRRRSSSASWPSSSRRAVLRTMRYSNARPLSTRR